MKLKLYEFIDKDDNPTGIKKYIGPLFPIEDEFFYAPISNGFKYITIDKGEIKVSENTKGAIIIAYNDEFLGAIETDELVKSKVSPKEVDLKKIENKDYKELLEKILEFANTDDNRIYIKQFAYANYNNKIENENKASN
jgi:hypothetical protein